MAASPQTVSTQPLYLTADTNVYNAKDFRKPWADVIGQGVCDYDSFRIRQRAAGANMSIDAMTASVQNRAWVRNTTSTDAGLYRVDFNSATQLNVDIAASDPSNPRIDQVFLCVEDSQDTGANNKATIRVVTGTATGGATLDNRTGVGSVPAGMSSMLLADVLVAAAGGSIANAAIRDRRAFSTRGAGPSPFTALDWVAFEAAPGLGTQPSIGIQSTANFDAQQGAALMYLPRRIVSATKIRFRYAQGATANAANFNIGIADASLRVIASSGATAYTGAASTQQSPSLTITAQTFDAGYYWVVLGNAAGTASAAVTANGVSGLLNVISGPNQFVWSAAGGTTLPTTLAAFTDQYGVTGAGVAQRVGVPIIELSVG